MQVLARCARSWVWWAVNYGDVDRSLRNEALAEAVWGVGVEHYHWILGRDSEFKFIGIARRASRKYQVGGMWTR